MKLSKEQRLDEVLAKIYEEADQQTLAIIERMLSVNVNAAPEVVIRGRYQYSFTAKLHQATEEGKAYYNRLKNAMLAYGFKSRMSWANESFYAGRRTYAKLGFSGKKLVIYLALSPADYAESKYYFKDASEKAKYAGVPMAVSVKSLRGVKWAEELIAIMASAFGRERTARASEEFRFPYLTTAQLLAKGLVKETALYQGALAEAAASDMREPVFVEQGAEDSAMPAPVKNGRIFLKRKDRKR